MITSNMSRADHPSRVTLLLDSSGGRDARILMDSVVMTDNLATVRENEIDRALGSLRDLTEVDVALRRTLSLQ
jgi:mRNA interferase MazF